MAIHYVAHPPGDGLGDAAAGYRRLLADAGIPVTSTMLRWGPDGLAPDAGPRPTHQDVVVVHVLLEWAGRALAWFPVGHRVALVDLGGRRDRRGRRRRLEPLRRGDRALTVQPGRLPAQWRDGASRCRPARRARGPPGAVHVPGHRRRRLRVLPDRDVEHAQVRARDGGSLHRGLRARRRGRAHHQDDPGRPDGGRAAATTGPASGSFRAGMVVLGPHHRGATHGTDPPPSPATGPRRRSTPSTREGTAHWGSPRSEGFGLVSFTASAYGNPSIVTGYGATPEVLPPDHPLLVDHHLVPTSSDEPDGWIHLPTTSAGPGPTSATPPH